MFSLDKCEPTEKENAGNGESTIKLLIRICKT
jgi:hypothetical protein